MIFIGIDPGLSGGIAILKESGELATMRMPTIGGLLDLNAVNATLSEFRGHVIIEHSQAIHKGSAAATFTFGMGFGMLQGIVVANGLPYTLVKPRAWQKIMHAGTETGADAKVRSFQAACRLFPKHEWRASSKCKKPHDGMIDSALLAEFGRRTLDRT